MHQSQRHLLPCQTNVFGCYHLPSLLCQHLHHHWLGFSYSLSVLQCCKLILCTNGPHFLIRSSRTPRYKTGFSLGLRLFQCRPIRTGFPDHLIFTEMLPRSGYHLRCPPVLQRPPGFIVTCDLRSSRIWVPHSMMNFMEQVSFLSESPVQSQQCQHRVGIP